MHGTNLTMARILLSIFLLQMTGTLFMCHATATPKFPAVLILGDSTVDTGNNNYVSTPVRSDHRPYGLEFTGGVATGRFSNGKLVPDMLTSMLGIKDLLPPFLDPSLSDDEIRTGVCLASAGSGLDDFTSNLTKGIPMSKQLGMFQEYIAKLKGIAGEQEASKIINDALIVISAGTNDFVYNFYDLPTRRADFNSSVSRYQDFIQQRLQDVIKDLYEKGGRKFAIVGLPPVGCVPLQISAKFKDPFNRTCVAEQNSDAIAYNSKLEKLLPALQSSLSGSSLVYVNLYDPLMDMVAIPHKYGFEVTLKGCCGTGFVETGPLCNPLTPHCSDRSKFLFWDSVHPSETAYFAIAKHMLDTEIPHLY